MKYVWAILFLFLLLSFFISDRFSNESTQTVFQWQAENSESKFVTIKTKGLTTKNFYQYFEDTSLIITMYPLINPLYKDRMGELRFVCQRKCNMKEFDKYYKSILEKNHFLQDSVSIDYYGTLIEKVVVYTDLINLEKILKKCTICEKI